MNTTLDLNVAIILVNWNGLSFTRDCLLSLRKSVNKDFQILLVDNASQNEEGKRLQEEFPEIVLLENKENLGFSGGNNVGIRKAMELGFSHVLLLNNDTLVEADFLDSLLAEFSKNPTLGVVQPMICFLHDKEKIWSAGGKWNSWLGRAITRGDRALLKNYRVESRRLDWATGCCMLLRREVIQEVGLLNEHYFAYFEDVEWSLRIRERGFAIGLVPESVIYHEAGASSKKKHAEGTLSPRVFYFHVRNQLYLLRQRVFTRRGTGWFLFWLKAPVSMVYHLARFSGWMGYFLIRGRINKFRAVGKGIREGFLNPLNSSSVWS